jgi:solute carrier family 35 (UDP-galactose transporter), member B1
MVNLRSAIELALSVTGIYAAYLTQGAVQEKLSTKTFGPQGQPFPHLSALHAVQSWVCFLWAAMLLQARGTVDAEQGEYPPMTAYRIAAATNCVGPACGIQALRYISYPAQVLAKSSKMIPIMLMGTFLHGRRYSALDYTCCGPISVGVALFAVAAHSSGKVATKLASPSLPLGYAMCFINLAFDGFTSTTQDEIKRRHGRTSPVQMMCWMNFWSGVYYLPYLFVVTRMGPELLAFCVEHPEAGRDVLLFCVCGALGQLVIYFTLWRFGSLTNALITTTRKFFSILLSVLWNGNPLLLQQWAAVVMVFAGLLIPSMLKVLKRRQQVPHAHQH